MSTRLEPVEVGAPPGRLSDWVIAPVRFNGFLGLPTTRNEFVISPEFSCFGHKWLFRIYPGGYNCSDDGYVALYLLNKTRESIEVEYKYIIKHPNGGEDVSGGWNKVVKFLPKDSVVVGDVGPAYGYRNFARRSKLINYLVDGTLIIEVHMRTNKQGQQSAAPFVSENPTLQNMLKDFGNEETADVKFEVGGTVESAKGRRKRAKTPTATFHAHHYPLRLNAPALADMCKPGDVSPTTISNVRPEVFKHLLYYCYGGKIGNDDLQSDAKDIIDAADRFGIVSLKLEAEACYIDKVELTLDNFIEVVTYADSKNLALLKEHCMDFLSSANKIEAAEKVSFDDIPSHLMKDLLVAQARGEKTSCKDGKFGIMRVSEFRRDREDLILNVCSFAIVLFGLRSLWLFVITISFRRFSLLTHRFSASPIWGPTCPPRHGGATCGAPQMSVPIHPYIEAPAVSSLNPKRQGTAVLVLTVDPSAESIYSSIDYGFQLSNSTQKEKGQVALYE
ncbi:hypothetical protein THAOC_04739 [Thalassiosira oceanica]|uniref:MATH domain-containing protein n=1 Tax=Thalassiosira oceanica TaxID=159749 RepID=K0TNK8_THAOC|nr:hypothetical protein THAOC_04739 [Thalassiosira oceanica]|eukprot:EJK73622.1 hypothetical protein THAOC_04739 [Thalassiosira oceanica]